MKHNKQIQCCKKIVIFTGAIFIFALLSCMWAFIYFTLLDKMCDWTLLVTIMTVSAAPFATSVATYMSKSREENKLKIRSTFLKEKYEMLNKMGILTHERANMEVEEEISKIDSDIDAIETDVDTNIY